MIKNLSQLKKALVPGADFEVIDHWRPKYIGQRRKVNIANTQGIYSIIPEDPKSKVTTANCGRGTWLAWGKASDWEFDGDTATRYDSYGAEKHINIKIKVLGGSV